MSFWRKRPKTSTSPSEIRSQRRKPSKSDPVEVQIIGGNSIDILHARDISATGLGVFVPHGFDECDLDEEVELVITLPETRTFMARGVIRHVTNRDHPEQYFGVEFTQIDQRHRNQVLAYVQLNAED